MTVQSTPNTWIAYRKTLSIDSVPETLYARIAADSKYWLWINGELAVFEGGLKRGPMPSGTYYDVVDIASYLTTGENTIAIMVCYFGKNGFSHASSGTAALLFDAQGEEIVITSDKSWRCKVLDAYGTAAGGAPNFRLSESNICYDARKALDGWQQKGYEGKFSECTEVAVPGAYPFGTLIERPIPQWKDFGLKDYATVSHHGDTIRCRMPYNCQATPYLSITAPAGKRIAIQTDVTDVSGQRTIRAEYITREGAQDYESYGWMSGHEMIYIIPEGVEVHSLKYRETGYDTELSGSFSSDDDFLNELWLRAQRTLYITMRDTYMDCPDRERAQWFGDEAIELGEAFYALSTSSHALALKGIHEIINWQRTDGTLFGPVPTGNYFVELPLQMLAFVGWYGFYTYYYYSGDSTFISDVYDGMHTYIHDVWQTDDDGFPIPRSGEWDWTDWGTDYDREILTTTWYYLALKAERSFAKILTKDDDAREDSTLMATLEATFDTRYWKGGAYRSDNYRGRTDDRAQAMAVVAGLAPAMRYDDIRQVLNTEYHASPYMEKYVLEALFTMGYADDAMARMHRNYSNMITNYPDCTTLFEVWTTNGSLNHAWTGGPLTLLSRYVCGIQSSEPAFASVNIAPMMGSLTHVSATIDTHYGKLEVSLQRKGKKISASITAPKEIIITSPDSVKIYRTNQ